MNHDENPGDRSVVDISPEPEPSTEPHTKTDLPALMGNRGYTEAEREAWLRLDARRAPTNHYVLEIPPMRRSQTSRRAGTPTEPGEPGASTFMLEDRHALAHAPELVWAAIRDPKAYFAWNPAAELLDAIPHLEAEMHLRMKSPVIGRFTYVHRIQEEHRTVTHELPLRLRVVKLGAELHTWRVEDRNDGEPGCVVHQSMDVDLDTRAGKLLRGRLEKEMSKLLSDNFEDLDTWLDSAPELAGGRFQVPDAHA